MLYAQPDMVVAGEASNGQEAIEKFRNLQPDVSLVDWNLPIVRGDEVILKPFAPEALESRVRGLLHAESGSLLHAD